MQPKHYLHLARDVVHLVTTDSLDKMYSEQQAGHKAVLELNLSDLSSRPRNSVFIYKTT